VITAAILPRTYTCKSVEKSFKAPVKSYGVSFCSLNQDLMTTKASTVSRNATTPFLQRSKAVFNFATVDEAVEYLKKNYDVDAEFLNIYQANLFAGAIEDFVKLNNNRDMFCGLRIKNADSESFDEYHKIKRIPWAQVQYRYVAAGNIYRLEELLMRCNSSFWLQQPDRIIEEHAIAYENGSHPYKDPSGTIYHELAHWLELKNKPTISPKALVSRDNPPLDFEDIEITAMVSGYTQKSIAEFNAEYVAARMCGLKFPEMVNKLHKEHYGLDLVFP